MESGMRADTQSQEPDWKMSQDQGMVMPSSSPHDIFSSWLSFIDQDGLDDGVGSVESAIISTLVND